MIYFIRDESTGRIKIGTTIRLGIRLAQLKIEYPGPLRVLAVIPGSYADELALHRQFAHLRVEGEWFKPKADLLKLIATEGQSWDESLDAPPSRSDSSTKIDHNALLLARTVANFKKISLAEYLSEAVLAAVHHDWPDIILES